MIEYHADDYGLFPEQSRHIMECYHKGALNGISIMPNSPYLKECMDEITDIREKLFVLPDETKVFPGHDSETTIGWEKSNNMFF